MSRKTKIKVFKIILLIIIIAIITGAIVYLWPIFKDISTPEGRMAFKQKIQESGFSGLLMLFALQFAQIFLIIIPGEPIEVLAGMCYGSIGGTVFITTSALIISTIVLLSVRMYGRKFVYSFCSEEKIKKLENSKMFQNPKKIEWVMLILFLIPGTPKDLLVYLGGLLPIHPLKFILISTFARFPSVISSTLAGANIAFGNWHISLLIYLIFFAITGIIIYFVRKFDKRKITEHTLKTLK